jgi:hypothetical protein
MLSLFVVLVIVVGVPQHLFFRSLINTHTHHFTLRAPQWCPTAPGIFAASSADGRVSAVNVLTCTGGTAVDTIGADFSVSQAPAGAVSVCVFVCMRVGRQGEHEGL